MSIVFWLSTMQLQNISLIIALCRQCCYPLATIGVEIHGEDTEIWQNRRNDPTLSKTGHGKHRWDFSGD